MTAKITAKITFSSHSSHSAELPSFRGVARQTVELLTEHAESHFSTGFCPEFPATSRQGSTLHIAHHTFMCFPGGTEQPTYLKQ